MIAVLLLAAAALAMIIVRDEDVKREEPPPHGAIGQSTAYRISDAVPALRTMEFRKRMLHKGAAIGHHPISHDEVDYVLSGEGDVTSDGVTQRLKAGMAAWLYKECRGRHQAGRTQATNDYRELSQQAVNW